MALHRCLKTILALTMMWPPAAAAQCGAAELLHERVSGVRSPARGYGVDDVAGRFSRESDLLREAVGGFLSGSQLHLFRDGTFAYTEWADVEPETVYATGTWAVAQNVIGLTVQIGTLPPSVDSSFEVVTYVEPKPGSLRLVGCEHDLDRLHSKADKITHLTVLLHSLEQVEPYDSTRTSRRASSHVGRLPKKAPSTAVDVPPNPSLQRTPPG